MDLKTIKYIRNTKPTVENLPGFDDGGLYGYSYPSLASEGWYPNYMRMPISLPKAPGSIGTFDNAMNTMGQVLQKTPNIGRVQTQSTNLPTSSVDKINGIGGIIGGGLGFTNMIGSNIINSKSTLTDAELQSKYGSTGASIYGVGYESPNDIDRDAEMSRVEAETNANTMSSASLGASAGMSAGLGTGLIIGGSAGPIGAAVGAGVGLLGGLVGGLFSGSKKKREAEERIRMNQLKIENTRAQNRDVAASEGLQRKFAEEHGDLTQQNLYQAAYGKEPDVNPVTRETYNKYSVATNKGKTTDTANAYVGKNEWIVSKDLVDNYIPGFLSGGMYKVKDGHRGKDDVKAHLQPNDYVFSDNILNIDTGNTIAQDVPLYAATGNLARLAQNQSIAAGRNEQNGGLEMAKCGRLPKFWKGAEWWTNTIPAANQLINAWSNYNRAASQDIDQSTVMPADTTSALIPELYKYSINPYTTMQELRSAYGLSKDSIRRSGGLSAGQKLLANVAANSQYQRNLANALFQIGGKNTDYKLAAVQANIADRQNREKMQLQANTADRANTAAAHNAKMQMMNDAQYSMVDAVNNFFANEFKRYQFNSTMDLYAEEQKARHEYLDWLINKSNHGIPKVISSNAKVMDKTGGLWKTPSMYDILYRKPIITKFPGI